MKRKNFKISYNGKEVIKHAWNASIREIERIVDEIAKEENSTYSLVDEKSLRDEDNCFYENGVRVWEGENGVKITFKIERV